MNTEIVRSLNLGPSAFGPRNVQNNKLGMKSRAQPEGLARPYPAPRPGSAGVTKIDDCSGGRVGCSKCGACV